MEWTPDRDALRGRVAVVAGATRGAGRGIAAALGEAGATVICTGRSSVSGNTQSDYDRPETIEGTAELVTQLGGVGIPIQVDHLDIAQVRELADRVRDDHGTIDILVNDIWGAELLKGGPPSWNRPIWEHNLNDGLRILRLGIDTHLITSHSLLPLLVTRPGGLLVEVTDGTKEYNDDIYRISVFYDLAKVAVNRLAYSHGHELVPFGAAAVAVTPGWLRSEMMLDNWGVTEENWHTALNPNRSDGPVAPRASPSRRRHALSGAGLPRSPPTSADRAGTSARSPPPSSRMSTTSRTSMVASKTGGVKCRNSSECKKVDILENLLTDSVDTRQSPLFYDLVERRSADPLATMYDLMLESNASALLMLPFYNYAAGNHDATAWIPARGRGG